MLSGCGEDQNQATPLQASASSTIGCKSGQPYQHTTLGYHLCFQSGWAVRDYTAEPGSGGAVSVVAFGPAARSEEHTSELQSQSNLVCRLLLEKKKKKKNNI